ncbi:DNA adenine methylase [Luteibacter aegosomaticola]|uniref:DNA adenine methylase n=1 Tax=Luteibacter aegosomaticola TaxID=2911538 RepID=UPI001FF7B085|nr:DNA adenine methylase [Luteibacter aegosomaticola]UPG90601.1 DNA adenine methylase [Luteibacter aegosomaticola]
MTQLIPYMGTKRNLAGAVAALVGESGPGPLLDVFAGMCAVGRAVGTTRPVWTNDVQHFAHAVAGATFCSTKLAPTGASIHDLCSSVYLGQLARLRGEFSEELQAERIALSLRGASGYERVFDYSVERANSLMSGLGQLPYDLFTRRFGGTYFGYEQAIDFDALRMALDNLRTAGRICYEEHRWSVIGLCVALSRCSTTTGHFAQALRPKDQTFRRFRAQRLRSLRLEWIRAMDQLLPIGSRQWRARNQAFRSDALELLAEVTRRSQTPSVIYADPPYTADQYSRYYHVYETALLYDYPAAAGRGMYRENRHASSFSHKTSVERSFEELVRQAADLRADLIISYPANGLLDDSRRKIPALMARHFKCRPQVLEIDYSHSTMGASKGTQRQAVTEILYRAKFR